MTNDYLETLGKYIRYKKKYVGNDTYRLYIKKNEMEFLEKSLQRLEAIDNTNPSEALKCLKTIKGEQQRYSLPYDEEIKIIEQALLKAQEQKKVLDIIFGKNVDIEYIKTCFYDEKGGLKEYNSWVGHDEDKELTEEEFDLLKRYLYDNSR